MCLYHNLLTLLDHILLDSGTNGHVFNKASAHLYAPEREAEPNSSISAGTREAGIQSCGRVIMPVDTPDGPVKVELLNVAYVPEMLTSIVFLNRFTKQNVHYDSGRGCLYSKTDNQPICNIYETEGGHYTFHKTPLPKPQQQYLGAFSTKTPPTRNRPAEEWHRVMAYMSREAINQLEQSTQGARIEQDSTAVPRTSNCETCALAKSKQIISRSHKVEEEGHIPWARLTVDMIHHDRAYNGEYYTTHLACHAIDYSYVHTHKNKNAFPRLVLSTIATVERRFNVNVKFIRGDNELLSYGDFKTAIEKAGIKFEPAVAGTQPQNGHSESKGNTVLSG